MALGEFALIKKYFSKLGDCDGVVVGVGDDAALLELSAGKQLVSAVDTLVSDVHFPANADPAAIAKRCLRVNLSDMAAMGATPKWFTLALTLPDANENWLQQFSKGLAEDAAQFKCALVGGDTTRGPLTLSIAMMGEVDAGKALLRSGAKVGDGVYVTGPLAGAAAALAFLNTPQSALTGWQQQLLQAYYLPKPCISTGLLLTDIASAAIDISDGLLADAGHIASQSAVGIQFEYAALPIAKAVAENFPFEHQQQFVLNGGDDYELCFTVPVDKQKLLDKLQINCMKVGVVTEKLGICCIDSGGHYLDIKATGYQHFD